MPALRRRVTLPALWGAAVVVLSVLAPAQAETVQPDQITYHAKASEDPAAKACMLGLAIKANDAGEAVRFQLVVARMKRDDALAGPLVFGFSIEVLDLQFASSRASERRAIQITSAAFASDRYTAAARPRTTPFDDGGWVASTLDFAEGGALLDAAAAGKFRIAYTRTHPIAARIYEVTSTPPLDVRGRFSGCIDGLQLIE